MIGLLTKCAHCKTSYNRNYYYDECPHWSKAVGGGSAPDGPGKIRYPRFKDDQQTKEDGIPVSATGYPIILIDTKMIPLWLVKFHKTIVSGDADHYAENDTRVLTMIHPSEVDKDNFPYLIGTEEVWMVYRR